jgi:hypothetical protein
MTITITRFRMTIIAVMTRIRTSKHIFFVSCQPRRLLNDALRLLVLSVPQLHIQSYEMSFGYRRKPSAVSAWSQFLGPFDRSRSKIFQQFPYVVHRR